MDTNAASPVSQTPTLRDKNEPLLWRMILPAAAILMLVLSSLPVDMAKLQPDPDKQNLVWGLFVATLMGFMAGKLSKFRSRTENWIYGGAALLFAGYITYKIYSAML